MSSTAAPTPAPSAALAASKGAFLYRAILVSPRQRGNPVISAIRLVPTEFVEDLKPDFMMGRGTCALYISIRYHLLHPRYIGKRMQELGRDFRIRVVLVLIDVDDSRIPLQEICRDSIALGFTALVGWSTTEIARYLEAYKSLEKAPPTAIMPRGETDLTGQATAALTTIRGVTRPDITALARSFRTVAGMARARRADLLAVPGFGDTKARRVFATFNESFSTLGPDPVARARAGLPTGRVAEPQYSGSDLAAVSIDAESDDVTGRPPAAVVPRRASIPAGSASSSASVPSSSSSAAAAAASSRDTDDDGVDESELAWALLEGQSGHSEVEDDDYDDDDNDERPDGPPPLDSSVDDHQ